MASGHSLEKLGNINYITNKEHCDNLSYDGHRLKWTGSNKLLRKFGCQSIALQGKWSPPGSYATKFSCYNSELTIAWYPGKRNTPIFHGKSSLGLSYLMIKVCQKAAINVAVSERLSGPWFVNQLILVNYNS